jgi:hypothetical protein
MNDPILPVELSFARKDEPVAKAPDVDPKEIVRTEATAPSGVDQDDPYQQVIDKERERFSTFEHAFKAHPNVTEDLLRKFRGIEEFDKFERPSPALWNLLHSIIDKSPSVMVGPVDDEDDLDGNVDEDAVLRRYIDENPPPGLLVHCGNRDREEPESWRENNRRFQHSLRQRLEDEREARRLFGEPIRLFFRAEGELLKRSLIVDRTEGDAAAYAGYPRDFKKLPKLLHGYPTGVGKTLLYGEARKAFGYPADGTRLPWPAGHSVVSGQRGLTLIPHRDYTGRPPFTRRFFPLNPGLGTTATAPKLAERICEKCEGKGSYLLLSPFPHTCSVCLGSGKVV